MKIIEQLKEILFFLFRRDGLCPICLKPLIWLNRWSDFDHYCKRCKRKWPYWEIIKNGELNMGKMNKLKNESEWKRLDKQIAHLEDIITRNLDAPSLTIESWQKMLTQLKEIKMKAFRE